MWTISTDTTQISHIPSNNWAGSVICLDFFTGSDLHVKSLIRRAGDQRWHRVSVLFHMCALPVVTAISWWLVIPV